MSRLLGRSYKLYGATPVTVVGVVGNYYRVLNHSAGHTTSYTFEDFEELQKVETKASLLRTYKLWKDSQHQKEQF